MFLTSILAATALVSVISLICSTYALLRAEKPRLLALEKRVRDLDFEVQGLENSYQSARTSLKRINSRYAMRDKRARDKGQTDDGLPDPSTEPEAWRTAVQNKYPRGVFSINGK